MTTNAHTNKTTYIIILSILQNINFSAIFFFMQRESKTNEKKYYQNIGSKIYKDTTSVIMCQQYPFHDSIFPNIKKPCKIKNRNKKTKIKKTKNQNPIKIKQTRGRGNKQQIPNNQKL